MKKQHLLIVGIIALIVIAALLPKAESVKQGGAVVNARGDASTDYFTSAAGIEYGKDWSGKFETRVAHVLAHTKEDATKKKHSVFLEKSRDGVLALLDEAWKKRGPPKREGGSRGRDVYDVPMGRVVGTDGEKAIKLVMEKDSATIVTAYPTR